MDQKNCHKNAGKKGSVAFSFASLMILNFAYKTDPYPNRFEIGKISKKLQSEPLKIRNWFTSQRAKDARKHKLCKQCRFFKSPIDQDVHDQDSFSRPCVMYFMSQLPNNRNKVADNWPTDPEISDLNDPADQIEASSPSPSNYSQFHPSITSQTSSHHAYAESESSDSVITYSSHEAPAAAVAPSQSNFSAIPQMNDNLGCNNKRYSNDEPGSQYPASGNTSFYNPNHRNVFNGSGTCLLNANSNYTYTHYYEVQHEQNFYRPENYCHHRWFEANSQM